MNEFIDLSDEDRGEIVRNLIGKDPNLTRAQATEVVDIGVHATGECLARLAMLLETCQAGAVRFYATQLAYRTLQAYLNEALGEMKAFALKGAHGGNDID